jgi:hypothetical protein
MAERDGHLHEVLTGYAKFLQDKNLSLDKHQPYLVRSHAGVPALRPRRMPDTPSSRRWTCFWPTWAGVWARSHGSFSRRRTRYASTAINTVEPRQGTATRRPLRRSSTTPRGWSGCARSSACATMPGAQKRPTCTGTAASWRIATKPGPLKQPADSGSQ